MKNLKKACALLIAASLCVMGTMSAFADDVVATADAQAKVAEDESATQVSDYKPATQSDDPNAVIATKDALERAAETANQAQVSSSGVVTQSYDFPNAAGQTVLSLSYDMLTVSEYATDALKGAVAAWNLQNAAALATTAASYMSDAVSLNAINGSVYSIKQTITMGLNNDQYFSFLITITMDTGGAHPNTTCQGVTMDAVTGKTLSWGDMTPYLSDFRTFVTSEITGDLSMKYGENLFSDANSNIATMVNNGTIAWYLTSDGMTFVLPPYTVLPYSYGTVTETVATLILQNYGMMN